MTNPGEEAIRRHLDAQRTALAVTRAVVTGDTENAKDLLTALDQMGAVDVVLALASQAAGYLVAVHEVTGTKPEGYLTRASLWLAAMDSPTK